MALFFGIMIYPLHSDHSYLQEFYCPNKTEMSNQNCFILWYLSDITVLSNVTETLCLVTNMELLTHTPLDF